MQIRATWVAWKYYWLVCVLGGFDVACALGAPNANWWFDAGCGVRKGALWLICSGKIADKFWLQYRVKVNGRFYSFEGGIAPLTKKLACFMLYDSYLKIINTFFWKIIYASHSKLSKELKNGIKIWVGQAVLQLLMKTIFELFWSTTYNFYYKINISIRN